jgi:hypothetical protein
MKLQKKNKRTFYKFVYISPHIHPNLLFDLRFFTSVTQVWRSKGRKHANVGGSGGKHFDLFKLLQEKQNLSFKR